MEKNLLLKCFWIKQHLPSIVFGIGENWLPKLNAP